MKKIAALLLTLSLVLSILVPEPAEAKTVQKRFTMRVRELKRLTIKNAKKRVENTFRKEQNSALQRRKKIGFHSGKKEGNCSLAGKNRKEKNRL